MSSCQYPVIKSRLASAARPVQCGRSAGILCMVPYADGMTRVPHLKAQVLCVPHASEVAAWKLIQRLPRKNFTPAELEWMLAEGVDTTDLVHPQEEETEIPAELLNG